LRDDFLRDDPSRLHIMFVIPRKVVRAWWNTLFVILGCHYAVV